MKLRKKTIIIITSISFALFIILHTVAMVVVRDGFYHIETNSAEKNVKRVVTLIDEITNNIITKSSDWGKWDDLCDFVDAPNEQFILSNLQQNTITDLDLNILIFFNNEDSIIYQMQYQAEKEIFSSVNSELLNLIVNTYKLTKHPSISNISSGMIHFDNKPFIIISRPIISSSGEGSSHGTLIFGKYLGKGEIEHISSVTNVNFKLQPVNSKNLLSDMKEAQSELSPINPVLIKPLDSKTIVGYTIVNDIQNLPGFMIRVLMHRDINKQSNNTLLYLLTSALCISVIYCFIFIFLMEKTVIARVTKLNADVADIGKNGVSNLRVKYSGNDELTMLSKSINAMLETQEQIDKKLHIHNNEMQLIMNTLQIGLFSINKHFIINPIYSHSSELILGIIPLVGKSIFEVFQLKKASKQYDNFSDFLSLLAVETLPDEEMQELNPCNEISIQIHGETRWIQCKFYLMQRNESDNNHILVELQDFTKEKLLVEEITRSEKENLQLKIIAEDPDLFKEFLYESLHTMEQTEYLIDDLDKKPEKSIIHEIFRNVHQLKGTCDSFGLVNVAYIASELEDKLGILRDLESVISEDIQTIQMSLLKLSEELYKTIQEVRPIFGEYLLDIPEMILRMPLDRITLEVNKLQDSICRDPFPKSISEISKLIEIHIKNLRLEPAKRGFAKAFRAVPSLIKRLEKNCIFRITNGDLLVDCIFARNLNTPLLHLIRNALDHGIETPEERLKFGKNETGIITCDFSRKDNFFIIEISDDGKGIDFIKLKEFASNRGILPKNILDSTDAIDILFLPGFTTKENVSSVSGRGVGLDAVYSIIKKDLGGTIEISTKINIGTTFKLSIPEIIPVLQ